MTEKSSSIKKPSERPWIFRWSEPESVLTVIPRSKTQRLAKQSQLANVDAERAINRAYQQELLRAKAISEAMFKTGKAVRYAFASSGRDVLLRITAVRKKLQSWLSP